MKLKRNQCIIGCFTAKELNAPEKAAWFQTTPPYGEYPAGNMTDDDFASLVQEKLAAMRQKKQEQDELEL